MHYLPSLLAAAESEDWLQITTIFFSRLFKGVKLLFQKGENDSEQPSDIAYVLGLSMVNAQITELTGTYEFVIVMKK